MGLLCFFNLYTQGGQDKSGVKRRDYLKNLRINGSILLKFRGQRELRGYGLGLTGLRSRSMEGSCEGSNKT